MDSKRNSFYSFITAILNPGVEMLKMVVPALCSTCVIDEITLSSGSGAGVIGVTGIVDGFSFKVIWVNKMSTYVFTYKKMMMVPPV